MSVAEYLIDLWGSIYIDPVLVGTLLDGISFDKNIQSLSGGEWTRVRIAEALSKGSSLLILDEPTNHLDVDAKAELKRALTAFKGTVILVSHEPEFYRDWVTEIWNVEDWTTKIV